MPLDENQMRLHLPGLDVAEAPQGGKRRQANGRANKLAHEDRHFHDWYRFVLSFPPHLVRDYLDDFGIKAGDLVLDPFCGTGTTLIECKLRGVRAIGLEANPFAHFASSVKADWGIDRAALVSASREVADNALRILRRQGIEDMPAFDGRCGDVRLRALDPETSRLLLKGSISPLPLHKALVLLQCIRRRPSDACYGHMLLAFASALVFGASNLRFGPEVGVGRPRYDAPVIALWLSHVQKIVDDLLIPRQRPFARTEVHLADARQPAKAIEPESIDAVITSPPYPNEKDYTRTTRLESVMLGFIKSKDDLRSLKKLLVRSNTRGVYRGDDDDKWVSTHPEIQRIAEAIEKRRKALGKTSGFERMYGRVTKLYFGGMARHFAELRGVLRPGARLAYVVGDQASYLRVMIRTGKILADIAQALGYDVVRTDLFRTRFSTTTKEHLREEVVVLQWNGRGR